MHKQIIRCRFEITFDLKHIPNLPCLTQTDWFAITPSNLKETKEKLRNVVLKVSSALNV